ncbi:hypothetical protein DQ384_21885 [Sphaerisporangium album]|uniref:Uncharacterized protein n=1 Tax=Sphaerisporangium album TaxID=509200 RepID=A0A367FH78_9ACTN|nr:hypothetical protein [Sphaerisporangium album]RCG29005.1 hypothetical protein DQ384_21885 [Sphaerisporangium album]
MTDQQHIEALDRIERKLDQLLGIQQPDTPTTEEVRDLQARVDRFGVQVNARLDEVTALIERPEPDGQADR